MAEISPLRGWRYDMGQVGDLSDVTAPPYDVINPAQQDELYKKHPCNCVRLILNRKEPGDESPDALYQRAHKFLHDWTKEGVLIREREDALYVYHQQFDWDGQTFVRKGFLGRLRLEAIGKGQVYPHEQTMPGPKADRLALMKACSTNLSPVFGLYPEEGSNAQSTLEQAIIGLTPLEATDDLGVIHRMWPVPNRGVLNTVRESLRSAPVFIADGHHRYETALTYREWLRSEGKLTDENHPANFILMMCVGMADPGLVVLPTHRLVSGLPELTSEALEQLLAKNFEVERLAAGPEGAREAWEMMQVDGGQGVFGFGTSQDGQWLFARLSDAGPMSQLAANQSDRWRQLGVSVLHRMILDEIIAGQLKGAQPQCSYVHQLDEVIAAQRDKSCQLSCLVQPAGIDDVKAIASGLETMPPKSTYFYPKLLSGLVFNSLE